MAESGAYCNIELTKGIRDSVTTRRPRARLAKPKANGKTFDYQRGRDVALINCAAARSDHRSGDYGKRAPRSPAPAL